MPPYLYPLSIGLWREITIKAIIEAMRNYLVPVIRGSKYGNIHTEYKGRIYDSKKEADYAAELDWCKKASNPKERVLEWTPQVTFQVVLNDIKICRYIADFKVKYADGREVIIDVKSEATRKNSTYKLKKKLVEAQFGVKIIEV